MKNSYILIGMPASGKSSIGKRMAKLLSCEFIDTDEVLVKCYGSGPSGLKSVSDFDEFVRREESAVLTVKGEGLVIATGGSVVYGKKAMKHLKSMGTVIYLEESLKRIKQRVGNLDTRGVILKEKQSFDDLYKERCSLYRHYADIIYRNRKLSPGQSARLISYLIKFMDSFGDDNKVMEDI